MDSNNRNQLPEKNDKPDKTNYLKVSIGYFIAWASVAYYMFNEFKESGGVEYIFSSIVDGNYYPVLLVATSIVLLALFMNSLKFYLNSDNNRASNHR